MTINTLLHIVQYSIKPLTVLSQLLKMYLDNNSTTKSHEMWMCVVSQYFAFHQENTLWDCLCLKIIGNLQTHPNFWDNICTVHGKKGKRIFSVSKYKLFHSSGWGGEDLRTQGDKEVRQSHNVCSWRWENREARKWGSREIGKQGSGKAGMRGSGEVQFKQGREEVGSREAEK